MEHLILSGNSFQIGFDIIVDLSLLLALHYQDLNLKIYEYSYATIGFPYHYNSDISAQYSIKTKYTSGIGQGSIKKVHSLESHLANSQQMLCKHMSMNTIFAVPPKLHTARISHIIGIVDICNCSLTPNNLQIVDMSYSYVDNLHLSISGLDNITYFDASGLDFTKSSKESLKSISNVTSLILQDVQFDRVLMNPNNQNFFLLQF